MDYYNYVHQALRQVCSVDRGFGIYTRVNGVSSHQAWIYIDLKIQIYVL